MERSQLRAEKVKQFNPNGVGLRNGHFIGLPFTEAESEVVILSAPWDVTVSFGAGTADGPERVLEESGQLDLEDAFIPGAWTRGLFVRPADAGIRETSRRLRSRAEAYLNDLEAGLPTGPYQEDLAAINQACQAFHEDIYTSAEALFEKGQIPGLLGGDHSTPFGLIRAAVSRYPDLGILQVDAHMDLRQAYEGFTWSHASIFRNVMDRLPVQKLVQVGIRDYCQEEWAYANSTSGRVQVYRDRDIQGALFEGRSFADLAREMISLLPAHVHISFDIDGLEPSLCPGTGTPVPGGLSYNQAVYLLEEILRSGRKVVSFDLCEVGGTDAWDANVGARMLYKMANLAGR